MNGEKVIPDSKQQKKITCTEIKEIRTMINHYIQQGYRNEVAFWRRILQAAKVSRRGMGHS